MTSTSASLQAADRQALSVVQNIHDVVATLEKRRERYKVSQDGDERRHLRDRLMGDLERLANLVNLLQSIPASELHPATYQALQDCLGHLRNRASSISVSLTLDKIRELRSIAEYSANRQEHPIGKSVHLKASFLRYVSQLRCLADGLSPEHAEDLRTSAISINSLIDNDCERAPLASFFNDPPLTPIDLAVIEFPPLEDDSSPHGLF